MSYFGSMHSLVVNEIEKSYGDRQILRGCSFFVGTQERVGIVGANGAGKSTLLRIISGKEEPNHGRIHLPVSVAILDQNPTLTGDTVEDAVRETSRWHQDLLDGYNAAIVDEDWDKMAELQDRLDIVGWDISHNIDAVLQRVQAPTAESSLANLSGGEIRRVALARTLLSNADLLILDEPTNHLDTETIEWLEAFLAGYRGSVLLVTHDRYLLEQVATRIIEVEDGVCVGYDGSYGDYLVASAERQSRLRQAETRRLKLISQEAAWAARSPAARSTKQKARLQRLDQLQGQRSMPSERSIEWNFDTDDRFGSTLMEVEDLSIRFGNRQLFSEATFTISPKERIGIVGRNGTGKSSLLKLLTGQLKSSTGQIHRQSRLHIGILDQKRSGLNPEDTVYESVGGADFVDVQGQRVHVVGFLSRFLFGRTMLDQKVSLLSGGERARLLMAKLLLQGANLLILDEPTNDLDLLTLRALEEALLEFGGGVLVVTHDRAFLDRVCTGILSIEEEQVVSYADRSQVMKAAHARRQAQQAEQQSLKETVAPKVKTVKKQSGLSYQEKKELESLPDRIEQWEAEVEQMDSVILDPATYSNPDIDVALLQQNKETLASQIEDAMERWEELSERSLD